MSKKPTTGLAAGIGDDETEELRPQALTPRTLDRTATRQTAQEIGFTDRGGLPIRRRKRRGAPSEPMDQVNVRGTVADLDRFTTWCEENRYSYGEGLKKLMDDAGIR